jgi:hypothetical protein
MIRGSILVTNMDMNPQILRSMDHLSVWDAYYKKTPTFGQIAQKKISIYVCRFLLKFEEQSSVYCKVTNPPEPLKVQIGIQWVLQ